ADGSQLQGFPVAGVRSAYASVESHGMADAFASYYAPVAVGDVDGDGRPDIVAASMEGSILAVDAAGRPLTGFPWTIPFPDMTTSGPQQVIAQGIWSAPVLVNLDDDAGLEIAFGALDGKFYVLDQGARPLAGFPIEVREGGVLAKLMSSPAVADINDDGIPDFVFGSNHVGASAGTLFAIDGRGTTVRLPMLDGFPTKVPLIRDMVLPT